MVNEIKAEFYAPPYSKHDENVAPADGFARVGACVECTIRQAEAHA